MQLFLPFYFADNQLISNSDTLVNKSKTKGAEDEYTFKIIIILIFVELKILNC